MYKHRKSAVIHKDDDILSIQSGTHLLSNPCSFGAENCAPVTSDGRMAKSDLRVKSGIESTYPSLQLDTCIQPAFHDMEAPFIHPDDSSHNPQSLQYDMMAWPDDTGGYELSATPTAMDFSLADTLSPSSISTAPTVRGYPFEDVMGHPLANQSSHQNLSLYSQGIPSPRLETSARPPLPLRGVPIPRRAYTGGLSRYHGTRHHRISPLQSDANSGGNSGVMFSAPLPYSSPDTLTNQTRRLQHSPQRHIQRRRQYGSRELFKLNPSLAYKSQPYPPPEHAYVKGQDITPFFFAFADSQNNDSLHDRQVTLESTVWPDVDSIPIPHMERASGQLRDPALPSPETPVGQDRVMASPLSLYPPDTRVDELWLPQPSLTGHHPAHQLRAQVPPTTTTTPTSGEWNSIASPLAFSDEPYNSPLQQSITCDSNMQSFTAAIPSGTHMDPSSKQYPDQMLSPFTTTVYRNDMAVNTPSTISFPGASNWGSFSSDACIDLDPGPIDTWFPRVIPQSHTPPELGEALPTTLYSTAEDSTVPCPTLADEKEYSSPAICPSARNTRGSLEDVVGPSSPLTNKALLRLLLLIIESPFIWTHEMEPVITSDEGQALLRQIQSIPDCPPNVFQMSKCSIFTLFVVARLKFRCLICGSSKQSMVRGVGCVRAHLNHRPYPCHNERGCDTCPRDEIVKRFFTASLLRDHCNRKERGTECTSCGVILTSSMKRHWGAKHPETSFPYDDYPNYRKE